MMCERMMEGRARRADVVVGLGEELEAPLDPFTYTLSLKWWDYVKVVFNSLWLFPFRLLLIVLPSVVLGTALTLLSITCLRWDQENPRPLTGWRKFILQKLVTKVIRIFLFGFGFHWIRTRGTPAPVQVAPIMVVGPHSSFFDVMIMGIKHVPTAVSRAENRSVPLFGMLLARSLNALFVSRGDENSRHYAAEEIRRRASSGGEWPKVMIFPEGSTTNRKALLQFKHGAFTPGLPVQPVVIKFNNRMNTMVWGDAGVGLIAGLFLTLCQFHNSLALEFLPVYYPSEEEKENPTLFAENVRQEISNASGIPTCNVALEDLVLSRLARELGLPYHSGIVEYNTAKRVLQVNLNDMKKMLRRFVAMDTNKDGLIGAGDLAEYLGVPTDACLQAVFSSMRPNAEELLSYRNYLFGVVGQSRPLMESEGFLQGMFNFFDQDGDGLLTEADFTRLPVRSLKPQHRYQQVEALDIDAFAALLADNLEYVLLFHECQKAGISSQASAVQQQSVVEFES